jgi:hypothetical protein
LSRQIGNLQTNITEYKKQPEAQTVYEKQSGQVEEKVGSSPLYAVSDNDTKLGNPLAKKGALVFAMRVTALC